MSQIITGIVVRGQGRGRSLGFPTANLKIDTDIPPAGVYAGAAQVETDSTLYPAALHVGPLPTFKETAPTVEVHLINFPDQDLYNKQVTVTIRSRIRDVMRFGNAKELSLAIAKDVQQAMEIFQQVDHDKSV